MAYNAMHGLRNLSRNMQERPWVISHQSVKDDTVTLFMCIKRDSFLEHRALNSSGME